jgi:ankyrin repeat protein
LTSAIGTGSAPLHFAAQEDAAEACRALLEAGASVDAVNAFGNTPLFPAVFNCRGRGDVIEILRAYGADPTHVNNAGQTPVGLARLIANYDVARFFTDIPD